MTVWQRSIAVARSADRFVTRRNGRRRLLFNARTEMNYAIFAPVHRLMARDERVEFFFTASESPAGAARMLRDAGAPGQVISPRRAATMRFDAYVTADLLWLKLPRGAPRVQMFHGVAGKYAHDYDRPNRSLREWNRHFFVNERRLRNFIEADAIDRGAARLVGMPKVDCLVDGSLRRDDILARLGLDPAKPTVLYAPTWSAASSIVTLGPELIAALVRQPWNVIVKLHDRLRDPRPFYSGGFDWSAKVAPLLQRPGTLLADGADISPYLAAADVMITDHSSAGFEYLLLDRPVVRIDAPQLIAQSNTSPDYVELLAAASTTVFETAGAVRAVELAIADPQRLSATRTAVARELFFRPGTATLRAAAELYAVMELEAPNAVVAPEKEAAA